MKNFKCLSNPLGTLFASLLMLVVFSSLAAAQQFFVSPTGDDQNAGTLDAPLGSIAAAQAKSRAFKQPILMRRSRSIYAAESTI